MHRMTVPVALLIASVAIVAVLLVRPWAAFGHPQPGTARWMPRAGADLVVRVVHAKRYIRLQLGPDRFGVTQRDRHAGNRTAIEVRQVLHGGAERVDGHPIEEAVFLRVAAGYGALERVEFSPTPRGVAPVSWSLHEPVVVEPGAAPRVVASAPGHWTLLWQSTATHLRLVVTGDDPARLVPGKLRLLSRSIPFLRVGAELVAEVPLVHLRGWSGRRVTTRVDALAVDAGVSLDVGLQRP